MPSSVHNAMIPCDYFVASFILAIIPLICFKSTVYQIIVHVPYDM